MMKDRMLERNFWLHEFYTNPQDKGPFVEPDPLLVRGLQMFRDLLNTNPGGAKRAIIISSGVRSEAHNRAIGGAPRSQHVLGKAADIKVLEIATNGATEFWPSVKIVAEIERAGLFTGRGLYPGCYFAHVDTRNGLTEEGGVVRWVEKIVNDQATWPAVASFEPWFKGMRRG